MNERKGHCCLCSDWNTLERVQVLGGPWDVCPLCEKFARLAAEKPILVRLSDY